LDKVVKLVILLFSMEIFKFKFVLFPMDDDCYGCYIAI